MNWIREIFLPPQATAYAKEVDTLYLFLVGLSIFFFVLIAGLIGFCVLQYRRKPGRNVTPHITDHLPLELAWSVGPLIIVIGVFFWGLRGYMDYAVSPGEALEIQVTGKKWLWQFEYPDGTRTINELHVPIHKKVRLVMTSEDVLHDFYIPAMRIKHDVVPNRYTEIWFQPEVEGKFHVACAEYCGKGHSDMAAKIYVESDARYKNWLETGGEEIQKMPLVQLGRLMWEAKGCNSCHSLDGTKGQGPSWKGIYGKRHKMTDGKEYDVDENYIRESILNPQAKIVEGFQGIMPTFQGLLRPRELDGIVAYIKSLQ
jgi:cytochrome c oxidase subunit 2